MLLVKKIALPSINRVSSAPMGLPSLTFETVRVKALRVCPDSIVDAELLLYTLTALSPSVNVGLFSVADRVG